MSKKGRVRRLVFAAIFFALALVLPFLTGSIPQIGNMLSPMHIPVLLCGFLCGWQWGVVVGFAAPLTRSLLWGMPPMLSAIPMAVEMAVYGLISGLMYKALPKKVFWYYVTLLISMVCGRLAWGAVTWILYVVQGEAFTLQIFWTSVVVNSLPGIVLQLALIPSLVYTMKGTKTI